MKPEYWDDNDYRKHQAIDDDEEIEDENGDDEEIQTELIE